MQTIGVTGGTGFIGTYVTEELLRRGYSVVVVDHTARPLPNTAGDVELFLGDVRDRTAMIELAAHVDGMIHLAAVLGTQETIANPLPAAETNILGGVNILDGCRQYDLPLVYAGVGNFWMRNTYSTTKTTVENLAYQYRDEFGCRFGVVRPVNAYGPRQRVAVPFGPGKVRKIVPAFVCRALAGMPIEIYGDGRQVSDMVYVEDVASVFVNMLEGLLGGVTPPVPVEVGPAESCTVKDVAELVRHQAATVSGLAPVDIVFLPMRPGEKSDFDVDANALSDLMNRADETMSELDAMKVRRVLRTLGNVVRADTSTLAYVRSSAKEFLPLSSGIKKTVDWYQQERGTSWDVPTAQV